MIGSLVLASFLSLAAVQTPAPPAEPQPRPIMVDIAEPKKSDSDLIGLAEVLWGSLGLTGVLVLGSVVAAGVFGGVLFWVRSRAA